MTDIESNLAEARKRIAEAAQRVNRNPDEITLVAVSKTFPVDAIMTAYEHGVRHFGENRAREGISKITAIRPYIPGPQPIWHMVGHIQSRKAQLVVENYDYVHSVDRLKIARRLSRYAEEAEQTLPVLLECNVSGEEAKHGFDLADWEHGAAKLEGFLNAVEEILTKRGLSVQGLMTMPPFTEEAEAARPFFASLRSLLEVLRERFPNADWHHLSMGMTNDFEVAVEEGATMVRVGRAIFGPRK